MIVTPAIGESDTILELNMIDMRCYVHVQRSACYDENDMSMFAETSGEINDKMPTLPSHLG